MSDELRGVVVCHARLAGALIEAAEQISGIRGALVPVSNVNCDRGTLEQRVAEAVDSVPAVVFVDMSSGSCLFAVLNRLRESTGVKVVTGVNLAMLVDFLFHRSLPPAEAAAHAAAAGGKAIGTR
jgi:mannose/fructose-specific phosphotransferase system component IIA